MKEENVPYPMMDRSAGGARERDDLVSRAVGAMAKPWFVIQHVAREGPGLIRFFDIAARA